MSDEVEPTNSSSGKELECEFSFHKRLQSVVETFGNASAFAKASGISPSGFHRVLKGGEPGLQMLISISKLANVDLNWLVFGENSRERVSTKETGDFTIIPRVDVRLAAGSGALNGDSIERVEDIPFTKEFLGGKLGRNSSDGLIILTAGGDSMDPLIADGDLVMVDKKRNTLQDGVYAFVYSGMARVKYLRPTLQGDIEVISQNPIHEKELLKRADLQDFHIIGKVVWCGHRFN